MGFHLKTFDGIGAARTQENGKDVDTAVTVVSVPAVEGSFDNSGALITKLAASEQTEACFAEQFFRFASARKDRRAAGQFRKWYRALVSENGPPNLQTLVTEFVASDLFVLRMAP